MPSEQVQNFAQIGHDVGLAVWYGGTVFGKYVLNPAVRAIGDESQRGQAANAGWAAFHPLGGAGLGVAAAVRLAARQTEIQDKNLPTEEKLLANAGDALLATCVGLSIASFVFGQRLAKQGSVPVETGTQPTATTPPEVAKLQRSNEVLGTSTVLAGLGLLSVQAVHDRLAQSKTSGKGRKLLGLF